MKPLTIGKKYNCEEEETSEAGKDLLLSHWYHDPSLSQKQKDQWRSYVLAKLAESCPAVT